MNSVSLTVAVISLEVDMIVNSPMNNFINDTVYRVSTCSQGYQREVITVIYYISLSFDMYIQSCFKFESAAIVFYFRPGHPPFIPAHAHTSESINAQIARKNLSIYCTPPRLTHCFAVCLHATFVWLHVHPSLYI